MRNAMIVAVVVTTTSVLGVGNGFAQSSFLDRGRDILKGFGTGSQKTNVLGQDEIAKGLREALHVGAQRVVGSLGVKDGFNANSDVHIPLPETLQKVQATLRRFGLSGMADDLELRLNRGAEAAVPRAKKLFSNAIGRMTLKDVQKIYNGPKDAATQYFRGKMSAPLSGEMKPIVDQELLNVGAIKSYDQMMGKYRSLPFVPDAKANLTDYVLEKAVAGVFLLLGREEAEIRENPAKRTTALLQKVFGGR